GRPVGRRVDGGADLRGRSGDLRETRKRAVGNVVRRDVAVTHAEEEVARRVRDERGAVVRRERVDDRCGERSGGGLRLRLAALVETAEDAAPPPRLVRALEAGRAALARSVGIPLDHLLVDLARLRPRVDLEAARVLERRGDDRIAVVATRRMRLRS